MSDSSTVGRTSDQCVVLSARPNAVYCNSSRPGKFQQKTILSDRPTKPRRPQTLALAAALGLSLGVVADLRVEFLGNARPQATKKLN